MGRHPHDEETDDEVKASVAEEPIVETGLDEESQWALAMSGVQPVDESAGVAEDEPGHALAEHFRLRQQPEQVDVDLQDLRLDRTTRERIRRGMLRVQASLDLHGCTQEEAIDEVNRFLDEAWMRNWRCVLVITGKGTAKDGGGVLRSSVPTWIAAGRHRERLIGLGTAEPHDGGDGALYVVLRKR